MVLQWHEPNFAEKRIPDDATVTDDLAEYAESIVESTKVLKEDLVKAKERLSKPDARVMEYLFPATIGNGITSSRSNIDKAMERAGNIMDYERWEMSQIRNIRWIDGAFFEKERSDPSHLTVDSLLKLYDTISDELKSIPGRSRVEGMFHGSSRSYDMGQHLPLFKGNESDRLENAYNANRMKPWHHEQIVQKLPPNLGPREFVKVTDVNSRNVLVDQIVRKGRDRWKGEPPVKELIETMASIGYPNPISTPYIDLGEQFFDAFPVEIGRTFCKMARQLRVYDRAFEKGNQALSRLERASISSITKIQDKRDHVIAMACILDYKYNWFSKGHWYSRDQDNKEMIDDRDKYLDTLPDKNLARVLQHMSDHFIGQHTTGSTSLKIGGGNRFLKKIAFS